MALPRRAALRFAMALPLVASARASAQGTLSAPLGVLRAVYLAGTPVQALRDPATGALRGIAYDLARELARRADIGLTFESRPAPAQVINAVLSGAADIGFVANAPFHSDPVLYSHNYLRTPHSVVVGASSPIHILAELDRPGPARPCRRLPSCRHTRWLPADRHRPLRHRGRNPTQQLTPSVHPAHGQCACAPFYRRERRSRLARLSATERDRTGDRSTRKTA